MTKPSPVMLLTPDLRGNVGGVANYYNVLRLGELTPIEYFYVNSANPEPTLARARRLLINYLRFVYRMLRRDYALIHLNPSLNANSFFRDGIFLMLARLNGAPRLVFFRGWDDRFASAIEQSALMRAFFRLSYGSCRNFIVLGARFRERLHTLGIDDANIWIETTVADARPHTRRAEHIGRNDDDNDKQRGRDARPQSRNDPLIALFMSRLLIEKGVLIAIDAVHSYRVAQERGDAQQRSAPSLELWIAGTGADEAAVKRYVESNGFDFVTFLGHVSGDAKWRALEDADILLFPTCYPEGLSNVVLEAMLHGLPVIARAEGALDEVLIDGVTGFVTTSTDPEVFALHLQRIAEDPELRHRISQHNLEEATSRFAQDKVATRILSIYDLVRATR